MTRSRFGALSLLILSVSLPAATEDPHRSWREYGGAGDSAQYSSLSSVNRSNVSRLRPAWTYRTGDGNKYAFNPLMVRGVLYVMAKGHSIVALSAADGRELWNHPTAGSGDLVTNRGINYWESRDGRDRRLFYAENNLLRALDATDGHAITTFGHEGAVDLRENLGRDPASLHLVQSTNPGRVFEDLLILGSATNEEYHSAPGDIRAYDVRSGRLVWSFHTIPHSGEPGAETWPPDAWKTVGGANAWSELTLDEARGVVYVPTASPKYNFYGANRHGNNLYGDSLLALDARTGKLRWYFQMVHHDIWDYDNAAAPKLLTVQHDGQRVDIVAQAGKTGFLWVFNRNTGKPLWPVVERPVPATDMPGEQVSPTQPFPTMPPPFSRQKFTADDLNPYITDPAERARLRDQIQSARNEGIFTPPSKRGTVEMPGNNGGANYGGAAADPAHGFLYVVSKDLPSILTLRDAAGDGHYKSSFGFLFTSDGLSAIAPPWTSITAYDLNRGTIRWRAPLGEIPELAARGIHDTGSHFPKVGPVVTAGGLIFTGTRDRKARALDATSGKVLWEYELPAGLEGMPAIYEMSGREYIVFCAAAQSTTHTHATPGHPAANAPIPGEYAAFALPN